jgi:CheY-like chemotaxis protein/two-component sensor histidine kinase
MSHEIRTPMHALIGFSEQLATTRLNQRQKSLLEPIRHSANYLLALINDVLDYSKLGSGAFQLEKTSFGPQEILQEVVQALQPSAKNRGIRLLLKSKESLPEVLEGDPLRLRQMLFNLIGNAIKFTEDGSVQIKPSFVQAADASKGELYLLIQDTGIGIPPDRIETIFSDFVQGDSSTTRKYGGTGLGLPITHKLAEMHGGSIKVESEVGVGTKVHLRLPYELSKHTPEAGQEPTTASSTEHLKGMRILLADDEPYNRALVAGMLEKMGIELDMVENGKQVLEKLAEGNSYDLMFLDLQMPEMDGMETARYIRTQLQLDTPILALTATSTQSGIAEARAAGMNAHLLKPFQESEMISLLNRWQSHTSSSESEAAAQKPPFEITTEEPNSAEPIPMSSSEKAYDLELLYKMSHQDPGMVAKMLQIFVDRANSLRQELQQALAAEDYEAIGKKAHQLIPSCRHLQLNQLVAQLKAIETQANAKELSANQKPEIEAVIADIEAVGKDIEAELVALGK